MKNSWWLKMMKFLMHHILALVQCASLNYSLWRKLERGEGKEIPIKQNNRKPSYGHVEKRKVLGKLLKKSQIARSLFVCYWIKGKVIGAKTKVSLYYLDLRYWCRAAQAHILAHFFYTFAKKIQYKTNINIYFISYNF